MYYRKSMPLVFILFAAVFAVGLSHAAQMPTGTEFTNSLGMKFVRIEPGAFRMGQLNLPLPFEILPHTGGRGDRMDSLIYADFDEKPVHTVRITRPFYIGVVEVTNYQYELSSRSPTISMSFSTRRTEGYGQKWAFRARTTRRSST